MHYPRPYVNQAELKQAIESIRPDLGPEVANLYYNLGEDWTGDSSVFFRIVLTDSASREETLAEVTGQIASSLFDDLRPYENWGLTPYFTFRSQSEQSKRNDPDWS